MNEKWKMICSDSAYTSHDGLDWKKLTDFTLPAEDDTKPTAYCDHDLQKYVISLRFLHPASVVISFLTHKHTKRKKRFCVYV